MRKPKKAFKAPKVDASEQIRKNCSFVSPKGAKCRVLFHYQGTKQVEVLNEDTGKLATANYDLVAPLLPKWNVNTQTNE